MPKEASLPIDFGAFKRTLAGSDAENPVNCGVVMLDDGTASIRVDKRKRPKRLAVELLAESKEAGLASLKSFFGTAFMDKYPGVLTLTLNKAPGGLNTRLRSALRGSGYNKIEIHVDEDVEA